MITTILDINIIDDMFILKTTHGTFNCNVIKGSIDCVIMDNNNKILPLSCLDIGNTIKLKLDNNIIKKIYINTKYIILSDSE
jgi:hypothetical protein